MALGAAEAAKSEVVAELFRTDGVRGGLSFRERSLVNSSCDKNCVHLCPQPSGEPSVVGAQPVKKREISLGGVFLFDQELPILYSCRGTTGEKYNQILNHMMG